jgi:diguanylate cyclase (GGDEF)-like protein
MSRGTPGKIESQNGDLADSTANRGKGWVRKSQGKKMAARVLSIGGRNYPRRESLESILSTALRLEDNELDQILRALSDLADIVKSKKVDSAAADDALRRAAVWAVEKSLLDREIRSLAITDELTGFFNRRGFLAAAAQQLKLAHRDRLNLLLFFCDLDNLKGINDAYGHREGDLAIIRTADALEETFRESDLLARLGGDEFAVLAWEASLPDVRTILGRLSKNLEKANSDEPQYKLSLSVGVARYDPNYPVLLGALMATADAAMYKQKRRRPRGIIAHAK